MFRKTITKNERYTSDDYLIAIVPLFYLSRSIDIHDYHFRVTQRINVRLHGSVLIFCFGFFIEVMLMPL